MTILPRKVYFGGTALNIPFLDKIIFASVTLGTGFLTSFLLEKLNKMDEKSQKKAEDQPKEIILKTLPHLKNLNKIYAPGTPYNFKSSSINLHQGYERSKIPKVIKNAPNVYEKQLR